MGSGIDMITFEKVEREMPGGKETRGLTFASCIYHWEVYW